MSECPNIRLMVSIGTPASSVINEAKRYHIPPSMTESYDPYANAVAERINGILKQEFLFEELNLPLCDMKQIIKDAVYKYNNLRPHHSCRIKHLSICIIRS